MLVLLELCCIQVSQLQYSFNTFFLLCGKVPQAKKRNKQKKTYNKTKYKACKRLCFERATSIDRPIETKREEGVDWLPGRAQQLFECRQFIKRVHARLLATQKARGKQGSRDNGWVRSSSRTLEAHFETAYTYSCKYHASLIRIVRYASQKKTH